MPESLLESIIADYRRALDLLLTVVKDLSDDQFFDQISPTANSIAFDLWHIARYIDQTQNFISSSDEVWRSNDLATRWGWDSTTLGLYENGTGMADEVASALQWPNRSEVIEYVTLTFDAGRKAVGTVRDKAFSSPVPSWPGQTIGSIVMNDLQHSYRHLGMIEALRGVMGMQGTATN